MANQWCTGNERHLHAQLILSTKDKEFTKVKLLTTTAQKTAKDEDGNMQFVAGEEATRKPVTGNAIGFVPAELVEVSQPSGRPRPPSYLLPFPSF